MSTLKNLFIETIQKNISLNPSKPIVVAMSGGIDSSFVAALLSMMKYKVIGITLKLYESNTTIKSKACCSARDIEDARKVSQQFNFPHYVLNYVSKFKKSVIDSFINSYMHGETPMPCTICNKEVKFSHLLKTALELQAQCLITGHYVIKKNKFLYRALDKFRDQSYFLFNTSENELKNLEFPLGYFTKEQVRQCAKEINLHISEKKDSQDICFVQNGNYRDLLPKKIPGNIISTSGKILGKHNGISNFTIGQRKGLGIYNKNPLYVVDFQNNDVIVGEKNDLLCEKIYLRDINLFDTVNSCQAKIRYAQNPIDVEVDKNIVIFKTPTHKPASGQACVFYDNDRLLGGGWICNKNGNFLATT